MLCGHLQIFHRNEENTSVRMFDRLEIDSAEIVEFEQILHLSYSRYKQVPEAQTRRINGLFDLTFKLFCVAPIKTQLGKIHTRL